MVRSTSVPTEERFAGARHLHHVMVRQMHHRSLDAQAILNQRRDAIGERTPAAQATDFRHPMLGRFVAQGGNVEYLAGFNHLPARQRAMTGIAVGRWAMGLDVSRMDDALQVMPVVPLLSSPRTKAALAFRFRLGPVQPVRRRRLAGIAAVLRQTAFEFRHLRGQCRDLRSQKLHLRIQCPDQVVLFGMTEPVKVGKFIHAPSQSICHAKGAE